LDAAHIEPVSLAFLWLGTKNRKFTEELPDSGQNLKFLPQIRDIPRIQQGI
jgi:hypothetical protein